MSNIENIYAGTNIYVEELDDNSVRIHAEQPIAQATNELRPYMDIDDYINDDGEIEYKYFKMINNVVRVNGEYFEIDDYIQKLSNDNQIYDIYLKVEMYAFDTDTGKHSFQFEITMLQKPDDAIHHSYGLNANYYHLYRVIRHGEFMESVRMAPPLLDITVCNYGFVGYDDYKVMAVRTMYGSQVSEGAYAIPMYSTTEGFLLIKTPFEKVSSSNGDGYYVLTYYGDDAIRKMDFDYFKS